MSAPKFMHGPWHFAGGGIIANDDDEEIGLSAVYDDDPNGRLIIAAPDLYAALVALTGALNSKFVHVEATKTMATQLKVAEAQARAALEKAAQ